ncbi:hypothetical protein OGM63_12610 [Plectonema radiosum NIES-515]|uniref:Uncharacterized protein n=1 Tax=Plectonema radiosum NIES-515 TaxID=2986073 RepID=A0ABT3AYY5_9CYAN|nr:hypothetical protein [Plectonema radiosum]MCV3214342.1 hypothetical protein [Plectonema radiosum NIES-515]
MELLSGYKNKFKSTILVGEKQVFGQLQDWLGYLTFTMVTVGIERY